jgi:ketosteroid isomerase-like protein
MANVTDDAMLLAMTPGGPPPVGRPALAEAIEGFLGGFTVVWDGIQTEEVVVVGDLAFHRYTGVLSTTPKEGGETNRDDRRYLDILRRDAGGEWKLWQHIFAPRCGVPPNKAMKLTKRWS